MSTTAFAQKQSLADHLLENGSIDQSQYEKALHEYGRSKRSLVRIFSDMGILNDTSRMELLKATLDVKSVSLIDVVPSSEVHGFISREACRKRMAVPLKIEDGAVMVAMEDPSDVRTVSDLEKIFAMPVKLVLAGDSDILECIQKLPEEGGISSISGIHAKIDGKQKSSYAASITQLVIVFLPIIAFYYAISATTTGKDFYGSLSLSQFENILAFVVVWGSWAAIAYFINDLIFGENSK